MFDYDAERLRDVLLDLCRSNISPEAWIWFHDRLNSADTISINATFSLMSRKVGKGMIDVQPVDAETVYGIKPGYCLEAWSADRLCRVCFLMHLDPTDENVYFKRIENLFLAAEMTELVALYSALPVLAHPEIWKVRCAEGIRSNIATVLEAIMYNNPYPADYLDEKAWNQLVMKAFFTDKDVNLIYGLDARANYELTRILSDYAHERWAAGRSVNPLLWRATSKFVDERILSDLKKVLEEGTETEQKSAAITIYKSGSDDALAVLNNYPFLLNEIKKNGLEWASLYKEL